MTIQDKCCTLQQGRCLVDLGVKPAAAHYHLLDRVQYGWHRDAVAPAYDSTELGDMLQDYLAYAYYNDYEGLMAKVEPNSKDHWSFCSKGLIKQTYPTEAQARAAMLVHLLENNLMELPDHWKQNPDSLCPDGRCKLTYSPDYEIIHSMPMPTWAESETAAFKAAWEIVKDWIIQAPRYYKGYLEANGRHVKLVLDVAVTPLLYHINTITPLMQEQYMRHDYRAMWELWEMLLKNSGIMPEQEAGQHAS